MFILLSILFHCSKKAFFQRPIFPTNIIGWELKKNYVFYNGNAQLNKENNQVNMILWLGLRTQQRFESDRSYSGAQFHVQYRALRAQLGLGAHTAGSILNERKEVSC